MTSKLRDDLAKVVALMNDREKPYSSLFSQENFIRTHHAEIQRNAEDVTGERHVTYQVWCGDRYEAGSDDLSDALHYCLVYGQDGPVELRKVVSFTTTLDIPAMRANGGEVAQ